MTTSDHGSRSAARHAADTNPAPSPAPPPDPAADDNATAMRPHAGSVTGPPDDVQELRREIEETREQLGDTVQQLAAKTDVTARARDKAVELTQKVKGKASQTQAHAAASAANARSQVAEKAEAARQQVLPVVSAGKDQLQTRAAAAGTPVWDATPEPVRQAVARGASTIRQHRAPLAVAASALVAGYLAVCWWRRR
jgi:Protein of unknown function (DUF3618)